MIRKVTSSGRMVYLFDPGAGSDFWEGMWTEDEIVRLLSLEKKRALGEYSTVFLKYLDKNALILDGGCGPSNHVKALRCEGYECFGIDRSRTIITSVKRFCEDLPLALMDITSIGFPSNTFGGYICLGTAEHLLDGIERPLAEAWRILRPGGILLVSVPHYNPFRRKLAQKGRYGQTWLKKIPPDKFYQYAFSKAEFERIIQSCNFEILGAYYSSVVKGLKDEIAGIRAVHRFYKRLQKQPGLYFFPVKAFNLIFKVLEKIPFLQRNCSHMIMVVGRKPLNDYST